MRVKTSFIIFGRPEYGVRWNYRAPVRHGEFSTRVWDFDGGGFGLFKWHTGWETGHISLLGMNMVTAAPVDEQLWIVHNTTT